MCLPSSPGRGLGGGVGRVLFGRMPLDRAMMAAVPAPGCDSTTVPTVGASRSPSSKALTSPWCRGCKPLHEAWLQWGGSVGPWGSEAACHSFILQRALLNGPASSLCVSSCRTQAYGAQSALSPCVLSSSSAL